MNLNDGGLVPVVGWCGGLIALRFELDLLGVTRVW